MQGIYIQKQPTGHFYFNGILTTLFLLIACLISLHIVVTASIFYFHTFYTLSALLYTRCFKCFFHESVEWQFI